jgi:hypothetical protein
VFHGRVLRSDYQPTGRKLPAQAGAGLCFGANGVGRPGGLVLAGRVTPSGLDAAPGRKPCAPLTGGNYFQPQAVLHRQGRQLTPLMKSFIEFLKQPDPAA